MKKRLRKKKGFWCECVIDYREYFSLSKKYCLVRRKGNHCGFCKADYLVEMSNWYNL